MTGLDGPSMREPMRNTLPQSMAPSAIRYRCSMRCALVSLFFATTAAAQPFVLATTPEPPVKRSTSATAGVIVGGKLLFQALDATNAGELWATDGTPAGTQLIKEFSPGPSGSAPADFAVLNANLAVFLVSS